jgi:hypothetical protein
VGTKYSSQSAVGYNSSPPSDDGSTAATNRIFWATIKTKLADSIKTLAEGINSSLVSALDTSCRSVAADDTAVAGDHDRVIQVTTASSSITLSDAATMAAGYMVSVHNASSGNVTVKRSGSDTINGASKNIVLSPQQQATFRVNTAANGYLLEGSTPLLLDATDPSKQAKFSLSGITTATVRTITVPDADVTIAAAATQAELETGSSTTVYTSPGRQQFHASAAKAWASYDSVPATPTLDASYNVSSLTDNGVGDITANFTTAFSSTNYSVVTGSRTASFVVGAGQTLHDIVHVDTSAVGSVRLKAVSYVGSTNTVAAEDLRVFVACYGDQ